MDNAENCEGAIACNGSFAKSSVVLKAKNTENLEPVLISFTGKTVIVLRLNHLKTSQNVTLSQFVFR